MKKESAIAWIVICVLGAGCVVFFLKMHYPDFLSLFRPFLLPAAIGILISVLFSESPFFDIFNKAMDKIERSNYSAVVEYIGLGILVFAFSVLLFSFIFPTATILDRFASDSLTWSALGSIVSCVTMEGVNMLRTDDGNE